jgi:hypothetical protein
LKDVARRRPSRHNSRHAALPFRDDVEATGAAAGGVGCDRRYGAVAAWWRGVESVVVLRGGDAQGVGVAGRLTWRSRLPYTVTFDTEVVRVEPMSVIKARASGGVGNRRVAVRALGRCDNFALQVASGDDAMVDEPAGADCAAGVPVEPRPSHAQRRHGAGRDSGG